MMTARTGLLPRRWARIKPVLKSFGPLMLLAFAGLSPVQSKTVTLDLGEARTLAQEAFRNGNFPLAHQIGQGLLQANPKDTTALLIVAATAPATGDADAGMAAGKQAYRLAEEPDLRFHSAYLTARAAAADERFLTSQFWLRRAYQSAHTPAQEKLAATSFRHVRARAPLSTRFAFNVTPSSNLNGGSSEETLFIDGVGHGGQLNGAARALSGTRLSFSGDVAYRFSESPDHATSVTLRAYRSFNHLSDEAKEISPDSEGSDFDYGLVELGLRHQVRPAAPFLPDTYTIAVGQTWFGLEEYERLYRVGTSRGFKLSDAASLRVTTELENRVSATGGADRLGRHLKLSYGRVLENKNFLSVDFSATRVTSEFQNNEYDGATIGVGYAMGEAIKGMRLSGDVRVRHADYDVYSVGGIDVGGRQDTEISGALNLHIESVDYLGFRPVLRLDASRTSSNVSRFEGQNLGLSIGFQSAF